MDNSRTTTVNGLSRRIAEFTVSLSLQRVPEAALRNAKIAMLDCLGVSVLAAKEEMGRALLRFARAHLAPGSCTVWGSDITLNARDAALVNGTLAHGLDFDDRGHASTYTLASALAAAEDCDVSGEKVVEGFIAGREALMTLEPLFARRDKGIGPGARGWHSNGILGPIGAACSASKVLGLDVQQTLMAIGLAAGSCGALTIDGGTMAKPLRSGQAATTGLTCAYLAKQGFTSDEAAIEGQYGLLSAVGPVTEDVLNLLGKDLGTEFHLAAGIRLKRYASCTATHGGVDAMLRIIQRKPLAASEVDVIECDVNPYPLVRMQPERGIEGRFSMAYCLSLALLHGGLEPENFTDQRAQEPQMRDLMRRVRHVPGSDTLMVKLKDGTKIHEPVRAAEDVQGPDGARKKFSACVNGILAKDQQRAVAELMDRLEQCHSIAPLSAALRPNPAG